MEEFEHAYFMDKFQLILLLSLMDARPVVGFPIGSIASQADGNDWKQVALSLVSGGRMSYQGGRPVIEPELRELLEGVKGARQILALYSRREHAPAETVYLGAQTISIAICGPLEYRVRRLDGLSADWLAEEEILPGRVLDASDAAFLCGPGQDTAQRLAGLEQAALPLDQPPVSWSREAGICAVMDLHRQDGALLSRWVWLDDPIGMAVLRQDAEGCKAELDTKELREQFVQECRMEGAV